MFLGFQVLMFVSQNLDVTKLAGSGAGRPLVQGAAAPSPSSFHHTKLQGTGKHLVSGGGSTSDEEEQICGSNPDNLGDTITDGLQELLVS